MKINSSIAYFEREGRENLPHVLKVVKRAFRRRVDVRSHKLVVFTAIGEGPALAYNQLQEYDPQIIAVTFPPDFYLTRNDQRIYPRIPPRLKAFFDGLGIKIVTGRLPFDRMEGAQAHNEQMKLIKDVLTLFGGSFQLSVQAALVACDAGYVNVGEKIVSITGDSASIITASTTAQFLSQEGGFAINEILCKPRNLTIARRAKSAQLDLTGSLFDQPKGILSPQVPRKTLPKP